METKESKGVAISFAAIDPYIRKAIPSPVEKNTTRGWVEWGERNAFPNYLLELRKTTPTLRSIICGTVDFVTGDDITILPLPSTAYQPGVMNTRGDTIRGQVHDIGFDIFTYGGFALQVVRSYTGNVVEVYYVDLRFIRCNKENSVFYYSEEWEKSTRKVVEYPAFYPFTPESWAALEPKERERHASSILYVKNESSQVYPFPVYGAALKDCETERSIADFHLNAIENSFTSSMVINFNNGAPSDGIRKEIERSVNEKFSGHQNAGRIVISWNSDAAHRTTFDTPKVEDFGARYEALSKWCRQQLFTAFRANPNLFGIPTESLGFSQEEYESAFRLYNRTCVRPVQTLICDAYDRIYGMPAVLTIKPFSLAETQAEKNVQ